ncbi:sigma-E processing peptidase SpoIIGA [Thomasclavelia saccharogumia]|uniref:sigma-E processing peptidase SpoIIGA n=1 Tax=Thomasclavelia saccharogumia TaxID=341225 RepID=UPI00047D4DBC|nr:sigma-E processing peptidase SpoIIGA [Thomasclavelia saccharogumia]
MEVYIEFTYISNFFIILAALEMMGILLSKEMTYLEVLKQSFLLSLVVLLLYVDKYNWLILVVWLVIFYCLFHKQMFLYYPSFIFIYFSILFFASSLIPEAFIYNGILITPLKSSGMMLFVISLLVVLMQVMFIIYLRRKVRINSYLYPIELSYQGQKYLFDGFLDSGNEVYYEGFPLILIKTGIIEQYEMIDILELNDLRSDLIEIIKVEQLVINNQVLEDVYAGIITGIHYDCLLNKALMGGVL